MTTQQLLFDPRKLARTDDPATSHAAARACQELRSAHHDAILGALAAAARPLTAGEIAASAGRLTSVQVSRRLGELVAAGRVRVTGDLRPSPSGRPAQCYAAVAVAGGAA